MMHQATVSRFLALLLVLCSTATGAAAQEWSLTALMASLAKAGSSEVRYHEARHLSILSMPLEEKGVLVYRAPGYLKKQPDGEGVESFEIEGERLRVTGPDGVHELSLESVPGLHAFIASLRATLAGDLATLQRYYRVSLSGDTGKWQLQLIPTDRSMSLMVREILIQGRAQRILRIETYEQGGDSTITTLEQDGA